MRISRYIASLSLLILPLVSSAEEPVVQSLADVVYKSGSELSDYERERCKLDVYLPDTGKNWPVLVWFHGGGLKGGDKQGTPTDGVKPKFMAASLARAGVAVVCPNYRFSPEVKFPAYLEDAAASVAWAKAHMGEHGADVDRLYVGGHSAGGWIAFMLGLDPQFLEKEGVQLSDLAGLIPVSGQTVTHSTVRGEKGFGSHAVIADEAAPVFYVRKETPPLLVIFAEQDMRGRVAENELFVEMMKGAGNKGIQSLRVPDRNHGTIASEIATEGDPARVAMLEFMNAAKVPVQE